MSLVIIRSVAFPNRFLRLDGTGVTQPVGPGAGTVNTQSFAGSEETFVLQRNADGTVSFKSTIFSNVYLRMDAATIAQGAEVPGGGGVVNTQFGASFNEKFIIHKKETAPGRINGIVGIESTVSPGRYLRLAGSAEAGVVNAQGIFGSLEEFEILVVG
ncbi:hypothetical protein BDN70DRAFT_938267 [Pholiota conissans]|uniref:Uncharacterized protein n=1 Tax=Pholiota conissans TaxID=109636 RepID=A0A9P5YNC5_9AGAR|nr:hypothetical protein BDN70DRAFT_938267 [Pholiota conissans]